MRSGSPEDIATLLAYSRKVIIVPGYGLAVAQGQHAVRELADELEKRGVEVEYAIHPVAGRMPGHMNVLLAEANVPYEQLKEMDQINDEFKSADVALVVGARSDQQILEDYNSLQAKIPFEFWQELRASGLIAEGAAVPT